MTRYVLLRIESDREADDLIRDAAEYPDSPLLTPCQENRVHATIEHCTDNELADTVNAATPDDTALTVAMSAARKVSILPPAPHIVMAMLDALAKAGFLAPTAVISDLRATAADLLTADDVTDHDRVAAQTLTDYADRLGKAAPSSVQGDTTPEEGQS